MSDSQDLGSDGSVNLPGQTTISYRATTHGQSLARLKAGLATVAIPSGPNQGKMPLSALKTLAEDEPTVALLDAFSTVLDVVSFYSERIASEGYLRTALEDRSRHWLAQQIGYRPQPALAASTYLAFDIDDTATMPTQVAIAAGSQVMSMPSSGSQTQTFETQDALTARVAWNALLPRLTQPQRVVATNQSTAGTAVSTLRFAGLATGLWVGSIVRIADATTVQVTAVSRSNSEQVTDVSFQTLDGPTVRIATPDVLPAGDPKTLPQVLSKAVVSEHILGKSWDGDVLSDCIAARGFGESQLTSLVASVLSAQTGTQVLTYRQQASFYGSSAPPWSSMMKISSDYLRGTDLYSATSASWDEATSSSTASTSNVKQYRNKRSIWEDSWGQLYSAGSDYDVFLDRVVSGVAPGSVGLLACPRGYRSVTLVGVGATNVRGYGTTARVTGLDLSPVPASLAAAQADTFLTRDSVMYLQSESLSLSTLIPRLDSAVVTDSVELSTFSLGLSRGQAVLVSGEHANQSGVSTSEVALLSQVVHRGGYTTLYFAKPLQNPRLRSSVSICANVVLATHGKTVSGEVLGSGDAGQKNQRFQLAQGPLTYLSDDSESGLKSTLSIRVSGVLWHPVSSLLAEDGRSRCYVVSHDADGHTTVTFGDGEHGARLPSGKDNVVATYRIGSGKDGEVSAGGLSILLSRPLGLRGVTNPIAAAGAEAAASAADILEEAPLSVATLGRAVSLSDYEVMAKLYPGIAKAYATAVRSAGAPAVHLTVASDDGQPLSASPTLRQGLMQTLLSLGDSTQPLFLDDYRPRYFRVALGIAVDSDYLADSVVALVSAALAQRFSFAAGDFGNSVRAADVLSVAQSVPGVLGAVLSGLWFDGSPQSKQLTLAAESARIDRGGLSCGAEILLILLDDSSVGVMP